MALIVEVINKQHKVVERHKFQQTKVTIGRAFNNDVVLHDKHVDPHHAQLQLTEEGSWQLHDLGSMNGSALQPGQLIHGNVEMQSGQTCWLGEQAIRIFDEHHPVLPALPYNQLEQRLTRFGSIGLILLLACYLLGQELFGLWLNVPDTSQGQWSRGLINLPLLMLGLALWPALLALWSKLNQHEARFLPQLGITFAGITLMGLWQLVMNILNFSLDGAATVTWLAEIGQLTLYGLLFFGNFYLAFQMSLPKKIMLAASLSLLLSFQNIALSLVLDDSRRALLPQFDASLLPPAFYLNRPQLQADFAKDSNKLFEQVDQARLKPKKK